jgi:Xaa-Pro aminopeptidase
MPQIHEARRLRVQEMVRALDADAVLITHRPNVRYLTGLDSSNAALLLPAGSGGVLATDSRYALAAQRDAPDLELVTDRFIEAKLAGRMSGRGLRKVAIEAHEMTVERRAELAKAAPGAAIIAFGRKVEGLRAVKDPSELELLAAACRITAQAITDILPDIRPGLSERALAGALEYRMVQLGADKPAFDTIVASGPNGAIPHHSPTGRPLRRGDLVTIDFGARYGGYHADMTRTFAIGEPAGWQRDVYDLVARAQRAGIEALSVGAEVGDVDAAARGLIVAAGHGEHFQHGLGHGVGLEIHEAPTLGYERTGKLNDRVPVTVEPGVYLPGKGGVRIEDVLVVTADGGARTLTSMAQTSMAEASTTLFSTNSELLVL